MLISTPNLSQSDKGLALTPMMIRGAFFFGEVSYNVDSNTPKSKTSTSARLLANSLREHLETFQALIGTTLTDIERSGNLICEALIQWP